MKLLGLLLALFHLATIIVKADDSCSNAAALQRRVTRSLQQVAAGETGELQSLRGILDSAVTAEDCRYLANALDPDRFVSSLGYEKKNKRDGSSYNAPVGYSGLGLKELASPSSSNEEEEQYYQKLLHVRERMRSQTEQSLGLCPNTLYVHYTQVAQKTTGGKHRPHADNCFHDFVPQNNNLRFATCDPTKPHPWPMRTAASILFLNDNFAGGDFYWANLTNGEPETLVTPTVGKATYFTSGPENLHGALPVQGTECSKDQVCPQPRRLALAMWYTTDPSHAEVAPKFGDADDPNAPKRLFEIPTVSMKQGALRTILDFYLLGKQNTPSKGSWRLSHGDDNDNMITMLFKDHSAMLSVTIEDDTILVDRHTDGRPSLQYQLQESVLLHGVLDELQSLAFGNDDNDKKIRPEDRLFVPAHADAIERCRKTLPARPRS